MPENKDGGENDLLQHYQECSEGCVLEGSLAGGTAVWPSTLTMDI